MSFDPNQNTPPMGSVPPKKSGGALKWILGGLGCFGLIIALCVGGFAYFAYQGVQMVTNNPALNEAKATLTSSAALGEKLGNPITLGPEAPEPPVQNGERMTITYRIPVSGPDGQGTATVTVDGKPFSDDWTVQSLEAEVNGEDVPLDGMGIEPIEEDG